MSAVLDELLRQVANPSEIAWNEETYDVPLASTLTAADRETYVAKLIDHARQGDTHAILTLAHLNATEALPMLRAAAVSQDPCAQCARRALVILGHGAEVVQEVANDAVRGQAKMGRVAAVMDLPRIGGAIAIAALEQALADDEDAVRLLAWDGLVEVLDLQRYIQNPQGKRDMSTEVEILRALLGSDLPAFVKMGVDEMRQLTSRLRAGASAPSLGLAWAPNPAPELFTRLRLALFDADAAFPVDEIAKLTGVPRRLAEMMIAMRLENHDRRVPEALVHLGATWTAPVLDEVAQSSATSPEQGRAPHLMRGVNRCVPDGWVLGASRPLPAEPSDFDWPDRKPPVGCNHLVCIQCNAEVRSQVGYRLPLDWTNRKAVAERATQMQTTDDWSKVVGIESHPHFRLYTCRCFHHSLFGVALTFDPDNRDMEGNPTRNLPWTCAGHPPLELPVQLGDRSLPDAAALAVAVVAAAQDARQADLVLGVHFRTEHGSLETIGLDALAKAAAGPAPLAPALKALFESQSQIAPVSSFLEELMRSQRGISRSEPARRAQLVDVLTSAVLQRPSGVVETGTLEMLRDEALQGVTTSAQLRMFELLDGEWLVAHVAELLATSPDRAGAILARAGRAMLFASDRAAAMRTLTALAHKTGVPAERLVAQAQEELGVLVMDSAEVLAALKG